MAFSGATMRKGSKTHGPDQFAINRIPVSKSEFLHEVNRRGLKPLPADLEDWNRMIGS